MLFQIGKVEYEIKIRYVLDATNQTEDLVIVCKENGKETPLPTVLVAGILEAAKVRAQFDWAIEAQES